MTKSIGLTIIGRENGLSKDPTGAQITMTMIIMTIMTMEIIGQIINQTGLITIMETIGKIISQVIGLIEIMETIGKIQNQAATLIMDMEILIAIGQSQLAMISGLIGIKAKRIPKKAIGETLAAIQIGEEIFEITKIIKATLAAAAATAPGVAAAEIKASLG
jgi:hypothetical protein